MEKDVSLEFFQMVKKFPNGMKMAIITNDRDLLVHHFGMDSAAYAMFYRGLGVTPDASLTELDTGHVLVPSIDYTPIIPDGLAAFRK